MRSVLLDKIASVTKNCALSREAKVSDAFRAREGDVIAVRVVDPLEESLPDVHSVYRCDER